MKRLIVANLSALLLLSCGAKEEPKKTPPKPAVEAPKSAPASVVVAKPTSVASAPIAAPASAPIAPAFGNIKMLNETNGWARDKEKIFTTTDGGATWNEFSVKTLPPAAGVEAVFVLDPMHAWLNLPGKDELQFGNIWGSADGGKTWSSAAIDIKGLEDDGGLGSELYFLDATHGWVGFSTSPGMNQHNGFLFGTTDGGKSWKKLSDVASSTFAFQDAMNGVSVGMATATEPPQSIERTIDGGKTWMPIELPVPNKHSVEEFSPFLAVRLPDASSPKEGTLAVLAGSKLFIYSTADGGKTWSASPEGEDLEDAAVRISIGAKGAVWLFSQKDKTTVLSISTDRGKTWSKSQVESRIDLEQVLALEAISDKAAIVVLEKSALKTNDGGKTWALVY